MELGKLEDVILEDAGLLPHLTVAANVSLVPRLVGWPDERQRQRAEELLALVGLPPERFARIWVHTHPGKSPHPSITDEETFQRCFGNSDWAVMFILARGGQSYARLRLNAGPGAI